MTDSITAVFLGIVEGITEFLPVSSTGHLLIAEQWLPKDSPFHADLFNVIIQPPAVLAVIPLFHQRFHQFIFNWREAAVRQYFYKMVAAFLITCAGGFVMTHPAIIGRMINILHKGAGDYFLRIHGFKLPEEALPIGIALLIGGVLFLAVEGWLGRTGHGAGKDKDRNDLSEVTWTVAIAVGIGQIIAAAFPGASRSGTTIILSLILGLGRPLATEFSFLVSIPTMLAAGGYELHHVLHHPEANAVPVQWSLVIIAMVVSAIVSFIAVKWLLRYVQTHTFILFGWYRILAGAAVLAGLGFSH